VIALPHREPSRCRAGAPATWTVEGRTYAARSRHGAANELAASARRRRHRPLCHQGNRFQAPWKGRLVAREGAALGKSKTAIRRFPETLGGAQLAEGDAATGHPTRTIRCLGAADQQMGTRLSLAGCTATISWLRQIGASSHRGIAEASGSHSNRALPTRAMSRNSNQGSGGGSAA